MTPFMFSVNNVTITKLDELVTCQHGFTFRQIHRPSMLRSINVRIILQQTGDVVERTVDCFWNYHTYSRP